jgi:hypothetical protein
VNRQPHPDLTKSRARTIYEAHGSRQAAEVLGISRRTVNAWAKAEGWQRRLATRQPSDQHVAPVAGSRPAPGKGAPVGSWQPRLVLDRLAAELWAQLDTLAELRAAGKAADARWTATVVGILVQRAAELAKLTGADRGLDPAASVARIHSLLDSIERRRAGA